MGVGNAGDLSAGTGVGGLKGVAVGRTFGPGVRVDGGAAVGWSGTPVGAIFGVGAAAARFGGKVEVGVAERTVPLVGIGGVRVDAASSC